MIKYTGCGMNIGCHALSCDAFCVGGERLYYRESKLVRVFRYGLLLMTVGVCVGGVEGREGWMGCGVYV